MSRLEFVGAQRVHAHNDNIFARLRQLDGVSHDELAEAAAFDFSTLAAGGGKGGECRALNGHLLHGACAC